MLAKMLAPNPADRLRSMEEVLAELEPKIALVAPAAGKSKDEAMDEYVELIESLK